MNNSAKSVPSSNTAKATLSKKQSTCTHHWVIDEPNGAESLGKCKKCRLKKTFKNWNIEHEFQYPIRKSNSEKYVSKSTLESYQW